MKRLLIIYTLLFNSYIFSQNMEYSIIIKDIETQLPVENITVVVLKTKQILLSNQDGKVTFVLNGVSNVQVYGENYENLVVKWETLKENQFVVYLENHNKKLDEIILFKEHPQKILQKIVSNSIQKITMSYWLKVYVREFFMLEDKYSYYNDGLVNFQFEANQNKVSTTLLVEQNRSYGLLEKDVSTDLIGYNLNNIMENYCDFKYFEPILDSKAKKEYEFSVKRYNANADFYIMTVIPIDITRKTVDNFEIIYDPQKKIIIEFTINASLTNLVKIEERTSIGSKNITKSFVKVNYRLDGSDYYLLSSNEEIGFDIVLKDGIKKVQVRNSFITTHFNKQNLTYRQSDVFKEKTLFNKRNNILTNYWDISGYTATDQEKAIIQALEFKM